MVIYRHTLAALTCKEKETHCTFPKYAKHQMELAAGAHACVDLSHFHTHQ